MLATLEVTMAMTSNTIVYRYVKPAVWYRLRGISGIICPPLSSQWKSAIKMQAKYSLETKKFCQTAWPQIAAEINFQY
jgi:hypothetical protein